jgi:tetratricopeptide (TPR) repeat protein
MMTSLLLVIVTLFGGAPLADAGASPNAEALFREGLKAYDAHDYPHALASFEAAYRLTPRPEILFDIAMTHRSAGDCARAAHSFDAFIAAAPPADPLLPRAQARRRELSSCASAAAPAIAVPITEAAPPPAPEPAAPPRALALKPAAPIAEPSPTASAPTITVAAAPPRSASMRNACAGSVGAGLALAAAGAVFGVRSWAAARDAEMAKVWDTQAQANDTRSQTFQQTSTLLLVSAGAASLLALGSCSYGRWWGRKD